MLTLKVFNDYPPLTNLFYKFPSLQSHPLCKFSSVGFGLNKETLILKNKMTVIKLLNTSFTLTNILQQLSNKPLNTSFTLTNILQQLSNKPLKTGFTFTKLCSSYQIDRSISILRSHEGRKASHNNFSSEPHSPHFLIRTTSKSSSFDYYALKSY